MSLIISNIRPFDGYAKDKWKKWGTKAEALEKGLLQKFERYFSPAKDIFRNRGLLAENNLNYI